MTTESNSGGCLCGAVRYEVTGRPRSTVICHCEYCQKRTGSTQALLICFRRNAVKKIEGPLRNFRHISDQGGRWIDSEFCEKCGSAVTWTLELVPGWRGFAGGTFDNSRSFPCNTQMRTNSVHPSVVFDPSDTCFPQQPPLTSEQLEAL